jgi:tetratricopeptide (TPR) repeat protein
MAMLRADPDLAAPRVRAMALNNLAAMVANTDPAHGRMLLSDALEIRERALGPDHPETLAATINLAWTDYVTSDYRECVARASAAYERLSPTELELRAGAADVVASCSWQLAEIDEGLVWIDRALEAQATLDPEAETHAGKLETKAQLLSARSEWTEIEAVLQRALIIREAAASGPSSATATTRSYLAWAAHQLGAMDRAEAYARASVAEYEAIGDRERLPHARILHARILVDAGRATDAMSVLADEVDASPPSDPVTAAAARGVHARALWVAGLDRVHAVEVAREALDVLTGGSVYGEVRDELRAFIASAAERAD